MEIEPLNSVLVVTPTYNEAENIEPTLARLRSVVPDAHSLIVDDNSPDGTGAIADRLAAGDDHIHVLHRQSKEGLAGAYIAGFTWGLDNGYDVIVEMDADGSHEPESLPQMLAALRGGADMVKGSRWVNGGETDQSFSRELLSRAANIWVQAAMNMDVHDATGGFNAFRASILRRIDLTTVASKGYTFQIDMTRRVLEAGGVVKEVPIHFPDRVLGESKMSGNIIAEALAKTAQWGFDIRKRQVSDLIDKVREG